MDFQWLRKKNSTSSERIALYLLPDRFVLCQVDMGEKAALPTLKLIVEETFQEGAFAATLHQSIKKHDLKEIPCAWVLSPEQYQLFIVDKPALPDAEIAQALRWQIKDLISYSPQDAAVQYVTIPSHHAASGKIFVA